MEFFENKSWQCYSDGAQPHYMDTRWSIPVELVVDGDGVGGGEDKVAGHLICPR